MIKNIQNKINDKLINSCSNGDIDDKLIDSCLNGDIDEVILSLNNGADIHTDNDLALAFSAGDGHLEVVKILLEKGANVNAEKDRALLFSVERENNIDIIKLLLDAGANIHTKYDKALRKSASSGNIENVKMLLKYGAKWPEFKTYKNVKNEKILELLKNNKILTIEEYVIKVNMLQKQLDDIKQIVHQTN